MTDYVVTLPTPGTSADIKLKLSVWVDDQDEAANKTRIGYKYFLYKQTSTGYPYQDWSCRARIWFDGTDTAHRVFQTTTFTYDFTGSKQAAGSTEYIRSTQYLWVDHNSDGTKTLSYKFDFTDAYEQSSSAKVIGDGSKSGNITLPPIDRTPGPPNLTSISNVTGVSFQANFTPGSEGASAITSYEAQYSTSSQFSSPQTDTNTTSPIICNNSISSGTLYYVRVRAQNSLGYGAWSNVRTVTTSAEGVSPHISLIPKWDASGLQIILSPPLSGGTVSSYEIKRTVSSALTSTTFTTANSYYFDPLILQPGETVTYQARATISSLLTDWSASATESYHDVSITATTPGAPVWPVFDGSAVQPAPTGNQTAAWAGTANASASALTGVHPEGWRTFAQGADGLADGVVVQATTAHALIGIGADVGAFDVMAVFASVQSAAGVRVGTSVDMPGLVEVLSGVHYYGSIGCAVDVSTVIAAEIEFYDESLFLISRAAGASLVVDPGAPVQLEVDGYAPQNAVYAAITTVDVNDVGWAPGSLRFVGAAMISASEPYEFFHGNTLDNVEYSYSWFGDANASVSVRSANPTTSSIEDPDNILLPPPPRPPQLDELALDNDIVWRRYTYAVPATSIAQWISAIPTIILQTGAYDERQVRIRYWTNPDNVSANLFQPTDGEQVGEQIVSFIPKESTMIIDGVIERVSVVRPDDQVIPADYLLYGEQGGILLWPTLSCGFGFVVTLDVPTTSILNNLTMYMSLTERMM